MNIYANKLNDPIINVISISKNVGLITPSNVIKKGFTKTFISPKY